MPQFKKNTNPVMKRSGFKMKGFSGFGNSPMKYEKDPKEFEKRKNIAPPTDKKRENPTVGPKNKSIKNAEGTVKPGDGNTKKTTTVKQYPTGRVVKNSEQEKRKKYIDTLRKLEKHRLIKKTNTKTNGKKTNTKTRKRGWFGLYDMGVTEALDAMTKVRNRPKENSTNWFNKPFKKN